MIPEYSEKNPKKEKTFQICKDVAKVGFLRWDQNRKTIIFQKPTVISKYQLDCWKQFVQKHQTVELRAIFLIKDATEDHCEYDLKENFANNRILLPSD